MARIWPGVLRAMREAGDGPVEVEFEIKLRKLEPTDRVRRTAHRLVARVQQATGTEALRVRVLREQPRFVVTAPRAWVREMMKQPEIEAAIPKRRRAAA